MVNVANEVASRGDELSGGRLTRVADLLALPGFTDVRVVAGHTGLDRVVERANVMEVPDIVSWVKPRELLLTTGYPMREMPHGWPDLVLSLDEAGVSALGVKLRRYLDALPVEMIAAADRVGMPLLLLPDEVAFDDLLRDVPGSVLHAHSRLLAHGEEFDHTLMSVVLDGGGLDELIEVLGGRMGGLTFVTTTDGRVLAQACDDDGVEAQGHLSLFVESGRFRTERFAPGHHQVDGLSLLVTAVMAGRADHGRLVVARPNPLHAADVYVLERAATVAALVVTKSLAVQAVEAKYRGDFVRDVLLNRSGGTQLEVVDHFASLGWDVARSLVVVVAALDPVSGDDPSRNDVRTAQERFATAWVNVVGRQDRAAPVVGFAQEVVALVAAPQDTSARDVVSAVVQAVSGDGGGGRRSFSTGVSRVVNEPGGIAAGYEQARRAVHVGRQLQGSSAVAHFDDLGAFRLLSLIEDVSELHNFVDEVLGDLADDRNPEAADMRATLRVLLDTNFNVAETSRRLHFHYNTLRYRIAKLEKLVGPFIADPDLQLDLSLALRVMQMRGL